MCRLFHPSIFNVYGATGEGTGRVPSGHEGLCCHTTTAMHDTLSTPRNDLRLTLTTPPVLLERLCDLPSTTSAVCSLCTRQGLPGHVVCDVIQQTLEAGSSGPAVALWVVHCLLRMVEADCNRIKDVNAVRRIQ